MFDAPAEPPASLWVSLPTLGLRPPPIDLSYAHPTLEQTNLLCSLDEELAQKVALFKGGVCIAQIDGGRAQPKCRKRYP